MMGETYSEKNTLPRMGNGVTYQEEKGGLQKMYDSFIDSGGLIGLSNRTLEKAKEFLKELRVPGKSQYFVPGMMTFQEFLHYQQQKQTSAEQEKWNHLLSKIDNSSTKSEETG